MKCKVCKAEAVVALASHNAAFCATCYEDFFRRQLLRGIESQKLLKPGDRILVAVSGGKDSLVLAMTLQELGYDIEALFIDLGIPGSSSQAREHVANFCSSHRVPLKIYDLTADGFSIPEVKVKIKRPVCAVCGKIKRYYFNKIALENGYDVLATGHNLDDETARLMSNVLRWDATYLAAQGPYLPSAPGFISKVKPLWRLTEFEIANYAFLRGVEYHCAACPYSPGASFSALKGWIQKLEQKMPGRKLDFYQGYLKNGRQNFIGNGAQAGQSAQVCPRCGFMTATEGLCAICRLKQMLNGEDAGHRSDC